MYTYVCACVYIYMTVYTHIHTHTHTHTYIYTRSGHQQDENLKDPNAHSTPPKNRNNKCNYKPNKILRENSGLQRSSSKSSWSSKIMDSHREKYKKHITYVTSYPSPEELCTKRHLIKGILPHRKKWERKAGTPLRLHHCGYLQPLLQRPPVFFSNVDPIGWS